MHVIVFIHTKNWLYYFILDLHKRGKNMIQPDIHSLVFLFQYKILLDNNNYANNFLFRKKQQNNMQLEKSYLACVVFHI